MNKTDMFIDFIDTMLERATDQAAIAQDKSIFFGEIDEYAQFRQHLAYDYWDFLSYAKESLDNISWMDKSNYREGRTVALANILDWVQSLNKSGITNLYIRVCVEPKLRGFAVLNRETLEVYKGDVLTAHLKELDEEIEEFITSLPVEIQERGRERFNELSHCSK